MKKQQAAAVKAEPGRKIEVLFDQYAEYHQNSMNKIVHWIFIPLTLLSILGLVWSIPFPQLGFLGQYHGYVNWASFLIAFLGFYYYQLSPVLSYFIIIFIFALSMGVVQLEQWALKGGPSLWSVSVVLFLLSWIGQVVGDGMEAKKLSLATHVKFLLTGPIWLLVSICKRTSIKY
jgi:uncharacterized membrane protein YGL010W